MNQKVFIDVSPGKDKKCCQNCIQFGKFGVHLGWCAIKETEMLDSQKCRHFENENNVEKLKL